MIAETDGWEGHRFRFHADRARDAYLLARGHVVIRFTWPQVRDEPLLVASRLAALLAHRGEPDGTPHRVVPNPPPGG